MSIVNNQFWDKFRYSNQNQWCIWKNVEKLLSGWTNQARFAWRKENFWFLWIKFDSKNQEFGFLQPTDVCFTRGHVNSTELFSPCKIETGSRSRDGSLRDVVPRLDQKVVHGRTFGVFSEECGDFLQCESNNRFATLRAAYLHRGRDAGRVYLRSRNVSENIAISGLQLEREWDAHAIEPAGVNRALMYPASLSCAPCEPTQNVYHRPYFIWN